MTPSPTQHQSLKQKGWDWLLTEAKSNHNQNAAGAIFYSMVHWHYEGHVNTYNPLDVFYNLKYQDIIELYPRTLEFVISRYLKDTQPRSQQDPDKQPDKQTVAKTVWENYLKMLIWGISTDNNLGAEGRLEEITKVIEDCQKSLQALWSLQNEGNDRNRSNIERELATFELLKDMAKLAKGIYGSRPDKVVFLEIDINQEGCELPSKTGVNKVFQYRDLNNVKDVFLYFKDKKGTSLPEEDVCVDAKSMGLILKNKHLRLTQDWPYISQVVFKRILFLRLHHDG